MVSDRDPARLSLLVEAEELRERGLAAYLGPGPIVLEIGFGRAELLMALAEREPARRFLGLEVSRRRAEKAAKRVERRGLTNVRLLHAPAEYVLERVLPARSVEECWINCPDPWPKKRHHKRRLLQPAFLRHLVGTLVERAELHVSTDHRAYAEWIHQVLSGTSGLRNLHGPRAWSEQAPGRPQTAYEEEWRAEGRRLCYFDYAKQEGGTRRETHPGAHAG